MSDVASMELLVLIVVVVGIGLWIRSRLPRGNEGMPVLVFRPHRRSRGRAVASHPRTAPGTEGDTPADADDPLDGTLQLLPGRLKVRNGLEAGAEIRFVRVPGSAPEFTFGRAPGPRYRHVQLRSLLVSRTHARLRFHDGVWILRNESGTNPTLLNGTPMGSGTEEVELRHGDRIEMGDTAFVLHHEQTRKGVAGPGRSQRR
jgi:pSer/pThr/pTyr-binding forkhead associated (FHA) protein